jgi:hypothetical protein
LSEQNRVADNMVEDLLWQRLPRLVIRCEHRPRAFRTRIWSFVNARIGRATTQRKRKETTTTTKKEKLL